jgi:hypothetical protein
VSLLVRVAHMVKERGAVTVDDLMPLDGYTRKQVLIALQNARYKALILSDGKGPTGGTGGSTCAIYTPNPGVVLPAITFRGAYHKKAKPKPPEPHRINSVFNLGQSL